MADAGHLASQLGDNHHFALTWRNEQTQKKRHGTANRQAATGESKPCQRVSQEH